jgi:signal transduction histidine kinase/CheY-like chemotaxis protein
MAYSSTDPQSVRVGVLAKRGLEYCRAKWQPTATYLSVELKVHDSLKDLKLGPYDPHARYNFRTIVRQYVKWIIFAGITFLTIGLSALCVARLYTRLSTMNADLTREVEKRKKIEAELLESEFNLRSALAAANEANKSKTEFLSNMSHELRTPMNGIIGMTSILEKSDLTHEQMEFVNIILKSSEGLLCIIDDILDYSNIEAGQSKVDSINFDLYSLLNGLVKNISPIAEEKGLIFSYQVDENVPAYLKGDARRIRKIVRFLTNNALKFTHQGTVSLHISLAEDGDTHCSLRIEVKDTGIGIAADHQEDIFNPFSQIDSSSTRKYGGTGLGLALAKHFAEMMGGSIEVNSAQGEGSIFRLTVPSEKQLSIPSQPSPKPAAIKRIPRLHRVIANQTPIAAGTDAPRILVVEDNVMNQKVMLKILGKFEYPAKVVDNGRKAVHELQEKTYDIVLMDIQMPVMNGFEATSAIRDPLNNCLDPQVPIIAVTANSMKADRKQCLDAGMNDYIRKPLNPKKLLKKIRQWHPKGDSSDRRKTALSI